MQEIITFQDLVAHVMDVSDVQPDDTNLRRAIRACQWGFQQATQRHQWNTYDTETLVYLNAPYVTGTISIDTAGLVTLTGGTWPTWAEQGSIILGDDTYRVLVRKSDTEATLESWSGTTVTDQAYKLGHNRSVLPYGVRQIFDAWQQEEDRRLLGASPAVFRERDRFQLGTGGPPAMFTERKITRAGKVVSELRFSPYPETATTILFSYIRRPTEPKILHATGELGAASGTVTLANPLPPTMDPVGSWLRISINESDTTADLHASLLASADAEWEGIVTAYDSATKQLTIEDTSLSVTYRGGVLTDVLDIPHFAFNAAKLYAEAQMFRHGAGDIQRYERLIQHADRELRYAMEQDTPIMRNQPGFYYRAEVVEDIPYVEGD